MKSTGFRRRRPVPKAQRLTEHHVYPKARFGDGKIVWLPDYFHQSWHGVFDDLTPTEAVRFLNCLIVFFERGEKLSFGRLRQLREQFKS